MGVYTYLLTTQTRQMLVEGLPQPVNLCVYNGKQGHSQPRDRYEKLAEARAIQAEHKWAKRSKEEHPIYVVMGEFSDGRSVYNNWPVFNGYPISSVIDSPGPEATFTGYLRQHGKRLRLERWDHERRGFNDRAAMEEFRDRVREFLGERPDTIFFMTIDKPTSGEFSFVLTAFYNTEDPTIGTLVKMVMAE